MIDLPAILWAPAVALTALWWTELIGLPVAWLRVRRTKAWRMRPYQVRRIPLLKDFIGIYVFAGGAFGAVVGLAVWIGTLF